jgi:hypothetical protein
MRSEAPTAPASGLRPYQWPEATSNPLHGSNPDGSTPGALQGDDYLLEYFEDGYPKLPSYLDRRRPPAGEEPLVLLTLPVTVNESRAICWGRSARRVRPHTAEDDLVLPTMPLNDSEAA